MYEGVDGKIKRLITELEEIRDLLEQGDVNSLLDIFSAKGRTLNLVSLLPMDAVYQTIGNEIMARIKDTGFHLRSNSSDGYFTRHEEFEVLYKDFNHHIPLVKLELRDRVIHPVHPVNFESLQRDWLNAHRMYDGTDHTEYMDNIRKNESSFEEYASKLPLLTSALEPFSFGFYTHWK